MSLHEIHRRVNAANTVDPSYDLNFEPTANTESLTVIMCSIDTSSSSQETLLKMIKAGMNIARIRVNGNSYHAKIDQIKNMRAAAKEFSEEIGFECSLAIALDTHGPEVRTGFLEIGSPKKIQLQKGDIFRLTNNRDYMEKGNNEVIYVDYEDIVHFVKPGDRIYLEHGSIPLLIIDVQVNTVVCKVEQSGFLGPQASVNLPGIVTDLQSITDKDKADMKFAVENDIDMILISFARDAETLKRVRALLGEKGRHINIIAKIENRMGVENIEEIIQAADGVLIGRGDLSIELPMERVFLGQKAIISRCNRAGKPVICSAEMLSSMMYAVRPGLSEISDVANAVLDGADCISLGKETASGEYPVEAVETAVRICCEAEAAMWYQQMFNDLCASLHDLDAANSIGIAAVEATAKSNASAIVVVTTSGRTAHMISKYRPRCPIIAVTRHHSTARHSQLYRGVWPLVYFDKPIPDWLKDVDNRVLFALKFAYQKEFVKTGDAVVVVTGWKEGIGFTNTLRVIYAHNATDVLSGGDVVAIKMKK